MSLCASMQSESLLANRKSQQASAQKRREALMALATSPFKQAGMMAFMMYMAGTQLHFFSIITTFNGLYQPLNAILKSGTGEAHSAVFGPPCQSIVIIACFYRFISLRRPSSLKRARAPTGSLTL